MAGDPLKKGRYTQYSNKIGLSDSRTGGFINNSPEVVLNFPFKDCVLEAGMTKEDAGRDERFLHSEIDAKDIDTLFDPKVLTDFRYVDENGERKLTQDDDIEFFDENGELTQNLLIKGNNLLALYTLKEKLASKVKLIYIDPPYNTGNDGFKYNAAFNHSSWLTFMKNRLEVARELLREDGVIFISCDDNEYAYLKVLLDEVYNDNFICTFIWKKKRKASNLSSEIRCLHEYILCYKKLNNAMLISHFDQAEESKPYPFYNTGNKRSVIKFPANYVYAPSYANGDVIKAGTYADKKTKVQLLNDVMVLNGKISNNFELIGEWRYSQGKIDEIISQNGRIEIKGRKLKPYYINNEERAKFAKTLLSEYADIGTNEDANDEIFNLFGHNNFSFPKPESLLYFLIDISTAAGDIVLDFCVGSGTTAAVAHKMHRRWIGIEQMDYIETISKERLRKVIDGEQGGISKSVNWQGGGSFVYFELKKYNQAFVDRITEAASIPEIEEIYEDMQKNAFLKFWFDKKEFEKDENFRKLDFYERKQKLVDILDENQFYLNFAEMEDSKYRVSADEKTLTRRFYQEYDTPEELDDGAE